MIAYDRSLRHESEDLQYGTGTVRAYEDCRIVVRHSVAMLEDYAEEKACSAEEGICATARATGLLTGFMAGAR